MIGRDVEQQTAQKRARRHAHANTQDDAHGAIAQAPAEQAHRNGRDHDAA